nr:hypothetical protein GCMLICPM_00107 [White spot syndrome virus]WRY70837.1 hypothetical protein GGHGEOLK_00109 [White spot syndrome virus]WRY71003.1 hypothetical protein OACAMADH_00104 [White spot syndrome virus]BDX28221.1 MAG: hypothetical protein [White spot syndrome virus]BDX28387.1 MAG: hypothetical protein [White spot syndrome virus]
MAQTSKMGTNKRCFEEEVEEERQQPFTKKSKSEPPSFEDKSSSTSSKKKSKSNKHTKTKEEQLLEFVKDLERSDPTVPDEKVKQEVEEKSPEAIAEIFSMFGIAQDSKFKSLLPIERIKSITTKIVIDAINQPVRKMLVDHLYHFKEMQNVVEKCKDDSDEKLSVILKSKKSPKEFDLSFSDYVDRLNRILVGVIKRVAGAIESKELLQSNSMIMNSVLGTVVSNIPYNMKINICVFLTNFICTFANDDLYTFFRDDEKFVMSQVTRYISKD